MLAGATGRVEARPSDGPEWGAIHQITGRIRNDFHGRVQRVFSRDNRKYTMDII